MGARFLLGIAGGAVRVPVASNARRSRRVVIGVRVTSAANGAVGSPARIASGSMGGLSHGAAAAPVMGEVADGNATRVVGVTPRTQGSRVGANGAVGIRVDVVAARNGPRGRRRVPASALASNARAALRHGAPGVHAAAAVAGVITTRAGTTVVGTHGMGRRVPNVIGPCQVGEAIIGPAATPSVIVGSIGTLPVALAHGSAVA